MTKKQSTSKDELYQLVTDKIVTRLQEAIDNKTRFTWLKPWNGTTNLPTSYSTGKPYRGVNILLLDPGYYATFLQIRDAGGKVKRGEKAHTLVYFSFKEVEVKDKNNEAQIERIPFLNKYHVFNVETQCENVPLKEFMNKKYQLDENRLDALLTSGELHWAKHKSCHVPKRQCLIDLKQKYETVFLAVCNKESYFFWK
jgi:antirestriction protein ArdC